MDKALVRAQALLGEARSMLDDYQGKLENEFNGKSEKWRESPPGVTLSERINELENISNEIENTEKSINELNPIEE
jgi:uncharacterized protein YukE